MPIAVTPVNQVDIDLANASKGDVVRLDFESGPSLFLSAVKYTVGKSDKGLRLSIAPELIPVPIYTHLVEKTLQILKRNAYEVDKWWKEQAEQKHRNDMFSELLDAIITSHPYVTHVQHEERPVLQFKTPFSVNSPEARDLLWTAPSPVIRIAPVEVAQVERQIGIYQGERELHALRVR